MKLTTKIMGLVISGLFISTTAVAIIGYHVNFDMIDAAAGEELVGCASITSGLVQPQDIQELLDGNTRSLEKTETSISWIIDHKPIFKNASVMTFDGKILAVDKNLKREGFKAGDQFYIDKEAVERLKKGEHPTYSKIYTFGKYERKTGYAPIYKNHDPNKEMIAMMAIDFDSSIIKDRTMEMSKSTLQLVILFLIPAILVAYSITKQLIKPILEMNRQLKNVSAGDLRENLLNIKRKDEIGELSSSVNDMTLKLRELIYRIQKNSEQVSHSSQELRKSSEQTSETTSQIVSSIHEIYEGAEIQGDMSKRSVEEMKTMVIQVEQGESAIQRAISQMKSMNTSVEHVSQLIKLLDERSQEINQIVEVISDIAEQTNLLALNAAIEAARAGEAGRGFAVVSDEVRKLAEQSELSAKQINQLIQTIQSDTYKAVSAMDENTKEVERGMEIITEVGDKFTTILNTSQLVSQSIKGISDISNKTVHQIQQVYTGSEKQLSTIEDVSRSIVSLAQMAEELQALTTKFRI